MYIYHVGDDSNNEDTVQMAPSLGLRVGVGKRDDDLNIPTGAPEKPVSTMQKTVIPLVIGLVLLLIVFVVFFFLVRRQRKRNKAAETANNRAKHLDDMDNDADDDFELSQRSHQMRGSSLAAKHHNHPQIVVNGPSPEPKRPQVYEERKQHRENEFV